MIKNPYKARFYIPISLEAFNVTAEPTLEGQNGFDILGNAIATTEQAINVLDGRPNQLLTVDTDTDAATWRIDTAFNKRRAYDAFILDGHNLLSSYPNAIRSVLDVLTHTSDAVGSATEVVPTALHSGLLGKERPSLKFNGVDDYVSVANDANLNFGADIDFSLEAIVRTTSTTFQRIIMKGDTSTTSYNLYMLGNGKIQGFLDGSAGTATPESTSTINDGEWQHIIITSDRDGNGQIYIDSIADGVADISGVGDLDDTGQPLAIGIRAQDLSANPFDGDIDLIRIWSRVLSSSEVTDRFNGVPVASADQWGGHKVTGQSQTFTGGVGDWVNGDLTSMTEVGGELVLDAAAIFTFCDLGSSHFTFEAGITYTIIYDCTAKINTWRFQESSNTDIHTISVGTDLSFTRTATNEGSTFRVKNFTGASDALTLDNIRIIRHGCVLEWNHDGISEEQGKWFDGSSNDLHGTVTGCEYVDTPNDDNFGFYLIEFSEVGETSVFWFSRFNADGDTAVKDTYIGLAAPCKIFEFQLRADGYAPSPQYPGIEIQENETGRVLAEEYYGRRDSWNIELKQMVESDYADLDLMLDHLKGSLYSFYVIFNDDDAQPIVHRVRMDGPPDVTYTKGAASPWAVTLHLKEDV